MRIITQDGTVSIDEFNYLIEVKEKFVLAKHETRPIFPIGKYNTEKRAQEVFDELHAAYEELPFSGNSIYRMPNE